MEYPPEFFSCALCPRLKLWREQVAQDKRKAYQDEVYWGKPVPGFGAPDAHILLMGLAPGAHGSNRTGRMFTGDASGNFLYPALFRVGLSNQPHSVHKNDGLELFDVFISGVARCVPPDNKPTPEELRTCQTWLKFDLDRLQNRKVTVALGTIGHEYFLRALGLKPSIYPFKHGAEHALPDGTFLLDSYHVSQQNTATGRLTAEMFDAVLERAKVLARGQ
ncbi:uracil-DNA glycosylase [Deinococcus roseus]|uniref:Type-5 uracil-DNA glycosylase n=1 Tax=Deinococcus roseus TaxID=392414 RepID=A0ABQ2CV73_9DEIO|nr:uracil-DNA glycosylase [Deinococcus roseus]GGJ23842.1 uracil-DNA glycosylase [Deinococcus roseus]